MLSGPVGECCRAALKVQCCLHWSALHSAVVHAVLPLSVRCFFKVGSSMDLAWIAYRFQQGVSAVYDNC